MKRYFFTFSIVVLLLSLLAAAARRCRMMKRRRPARRRWIPPGGGAPGGGAGSHCGADRCHDSGRKGGAAVFVRCPEENAAEDAAQYHLGGMILLAGIFKGKTYAQVRALTEELQQSADIPLLIGADEEGGTVVRAKRTPSACRQVFPRPRRCTLWGSVLCAAMRRKKSSFLLGLGVNVNFARCATFPPTPEIISYPRTLGAPAEETAEYVSAVVEEMNRAGIGGVLEAFSAME